MANNAFRDLVVCILRHQKQEYANDDQFSPNFDMVYNTIQLVYVPNLKSFGLMKTDLSAKESWRSFYYVIWENGLVGIPLPTNMAAAV